MDLSGVFTALITPFNEDETLDEVSFRSQIDRQIENGITGIVPCGTTGESPTLSHVEHDRVIEIAIEQAQGKALVVAGTGSNSTKEAVRLSQHAEQAGADAVLVVNPYYNKPSQKGLFLHFKTVADSIKIPVILYNIEGRTGVNLQTETLLKLARECKNIVAVKEASGSLDQMKEVINATDKNFKVLSGDDGLTLPLIKAGGDGVISVTSNLYPKKMMELVTAARAGKMADAEAMHKELSELFDVLFIETNPVPVKTAMVMMGLCKEVFRLPLCPLSTEQNRKAVENALKKMGTL